MDLEAVIFRDKIMHKNFIKIIIVLFLFTISLTAQNRFYAEYYFDLDPGFGLGTPIAATEGDSVFSFSPDKSNLKPGFHIMYVRSRDNFGRWTQHVLSPLFIPGEQQDTTKSNVVYSEYFFDLDPGFGNGHGMSLTASTNTEGSFTVDKSNLKPGFHTFYVRARDEKNRWTLHVAQPFLILGPVEKTTSKISAIEYYFFKDGVPSDTFRVSDFQPGTDVEISFQPDFTNLLQDSTYDFHVYAIDSLGRRSLDFVYGDQIISDISDNQITTLLPKTLELKANYPNPFNPSTMIEFGLPKTQNVKLVIYDIIGRKVAELINKQMEAGYHKIKWDGKNNFGQQAASGFYIYQVSTSQKVISRKMILLK